MKKLFFLFAFTLITQALFAQNSIQDSLFTIFNYQLIDENLSSAGMPKEHQFDWIQEAGFTHVINLIPGDFSEEKEKLKKMDISFKHIEVDFKNPTQKDFKVFVKDMEKHSGEKILVHCAANMRASAFVYAYRVTQLDHDKDEAYKLVSEIWDPHGGLSIAWKSFVDQALNSDK